MNSAHFSRFTSMFLWGPLLLCLTMLSWGVQGEEGERRTEVYIRPMNGSVATEYAPLIDALQSSSFLSLLAALLTGNFLPWVSVCSLLSVHKVDHVCFTKVDLSVNSSANISSLDNSTKVLSNCDEGPAHLLSSILFAGYWAVGPWGLVPRLYGTLLGTLMIVFFFSVCHFTVMSLYSWRAKFSKSKAMESFQWPSRSLLAVSIAFAPSSVEAFMLVFSIRSGGDGGSFFIGGLGMVLIAFWLCLVVYGCVLAHGAFFIRYHPDFVVGTEARQSAHVESYLTRKAVSSALWTTSESKAEGGEDSIALPESAEDVEVVSVPEQLERLFLPHGFWSPPNELHVWGDLGLYYVRGSTVLWALSPYLYITVVAFFANARVISDRGRFLACASTTFLYVIVMALRRPFISRWNVVFVCVEGVFLSLLQALPAISDFWGKEEPLLIVFISLNMASAVLIILVWILEHFKWRPAEESFRRKSIAPVDIDAIRARLKTEGERSVAPKRERGPLLASFITEPKEASPQRRFSEKFGIRHTSEEENALSELQQSLSRHEEEQRRIDAIVEQRVRELQANKPGKMSIGCQATLTPMQVFCRGEEGEGEEKEGQGGKRRAAEALRAANRADARRQLQDELFSSSHSWNALAAETDEAPKFVRAKNLKKLRDVSVPHFRCVPSESGSEDTCVDEPSNLRIDARDQHTEESTSKDMNVSTLGPFVPRDENGEEVSPIALYDLPQDDPRRVDSRILEQAEDTAKIEVSQILEEWPIAQNVNELRKRLDRGLVREGW